MKKKYLKGIALALTVFTLCGCQKTPDQEYVSSKNNGVLEDKINQTGPSGAKHTGQTEVKNSEQFTSTDGSVQFTLNVDSELQLNVQQVVEVKPHPLTEEDVERVARVLAGDADFYERQSSSHPQYSLEQCQQKLQQLSQYASHESLAKLMGEGDAYAYLEFVQGYIEAWTERAASAPQKDPRVPCTWKLKKEREYNDSEVEIGNRPVDEDKDVIYANTEIDGVVYQYYVGTSDSDSYKLNQISLGLTEGIGLMPVDEAIYRAKLCRTEKPSEAVVHKLSQQASDMLKAMELGNWEIVETKVEEKTIGDITEYSVTISAVPVINGVAAMYHQPDSDPYTSYNAAYPMTSAAFELSGNGDILHFCMNSPLDVVSVRNENVETLPVTELLEKCKNHLKLSDFEAYGLPAYDRRIMEETNGEKLLCQVNISGAEYCLGRVPVQNSDDHYYYVPVMALGGTAGFVGEKTGTLYFGNAESKDGEWVPPLVCINAVDGTLIQN